MKCPTFFGNKSPSSGGHNTKAYRINTSSFTYTILKKVLKISKS